MGPCLQRDRVCLVRCPRDRDAARPGDRTARRGSQIAIDRGRAGIGHGGGTQHREALRRSQERSRRGRRGTTQPRRKRDDEGQASTRPSRTFRDTHLRRPFLEWMTLGWLPSPTSHPDPRQPATRRARVPSGAVTPPKTCGPRAFGPRRGSLGIYSGPDSRTHCRGRPLVHR